MVYTHEKGFGKSVIDVQNTFKNNYYRNKKLKWSLN